MTTNPFADKINVVYGFIASVLGAFLGAHWFLFVAFLIANIVDYGTGVMKAYLAGKENSGKGLRGVVKKIGYWIIVLLGYGMSAVFMEVGKAIGIDLSAASWIGLLTLCILIMNEFRSILENLVEAGYHPPEILIKGLEVVNKAIDDVVSIRDDGSIEIPGVKLGNDGSVILEEGGKIMEQLLKKGSYTIHLDKSKKTDEGG